jgi:hypothetical protein
MAGKPLRSFLRNRVAYLQQNKMIETIASENRKRLLNKGSEIGLYFVQMPSCEVAEKVCVNR